MKNKETKFDLSATATILLIIGIVLEVIAVIVNRLSVLSKNTIMIIFLVSAGFLAFSIPLIFVKLIRFKREYAKICDKKLDPRKRVKICFILFLTSLTLTLISTVVLSFSTEKNVNIFFHIINATLTTLFIFAELRSIEYEQSLYSLKKENI